MNCPQCGAGIQHSKSLSKHTECTYCGSMLAVFAQADDERDDKRDEKYSHTGSTAQPRQHCPRCHHKLASTRIGRSHLGNCHQCGGVWLPMKAVLGLKKMSKRTRLAYARVNKPHDWRRSSDTRNHHEAVHCPTCSQLMSTKIYRGDHVVVVDICASGHGVWFDARELTIAHKGTRSRALRYHRDDDGFLGDWDFLFRRGRRYHPLYLVLRIIAEIIEEIFD